MSVYDIVFANIFSAVYKLLCLACHSEKKKYFSTFFRPHFYFIFEPATIIYFVFKFKHFNEMVAKWENFDFF